MTLLLLFLRLEKWYSSLNKYLSKNDKRKKDSKSQASRKLAFVVSRLDFWLHFLRVDRGVKNTQPNIFLIVCRTSWTFGFFFIAVGMEMTHVLFLNGVNNCVLHWIFCSCFNSLYHCWRLKTQQLLFKIAWVLCWNFVSLLWT